ncbi:hypothetical protein PQX77_011667 [Marasmius sp. AFHP31]|nr:hypothetical protein PQX77_011667 [Marasmius sp. AFHP31]
MARRIDDRDSQLIFTPEDAWFPGGGQSEYRETTHGTSTAGARMSFEFIGTGVEVYGTISGNLAIPAVVNHFTLDGGTPSVWSPSPRRPFAFYNVQMFSARGLEDAVAHKLVMEVMVNHSETWIDYVQFPLSEPSPTPSQPINAASSSEPSKAPRSTPLGLVAGVSVLGTLVFTLGMLHLIWYLWRRRMRNSKGNLDSEARTEITGE